MDGVAEPRLPLLPLLVDVSAIGGFLKTDRHSMERADTEQFLIFSEPNKKEKKQKNILVLTCRGEEVKEREKSKPPPPRQITKTSPLPSPSKQFRKTDPISTKKEPLISVLLLRGFKFNTIMFLTGNAASALMITLTGPTVVLVAQFNP